MGVAGLALVADDAQEVSLAALGVDRLAQGSTVDGQGLVLGVLEVPALQGAAQRVGVDAGQHRADDGEAGDLVGGVLAHTGKICGSA
ncbi:MAG: hypothetical protein WAT23_19120 [Chromatiaceae bacterium]